MIKPHTLISNKINSLIDNKIMIIKQILTHYQYTSRVETGVSSCCTYPYSLKCACLDVKLTI